jgi:metal-responsive CopG/Arc/MetJ family transcriptional regulator
MATVNYSVPEDVKRAFNRAFAGENRSAIIAQLMREAVARRERLDACREALARVAARARTRRAVSEATIRKARAAGRP